MTLEATVLHRWTREQYARLIEHAAVDRFRADATVAPLAVSHAAILVADLLP